MADKLGQVRDLVRAVAQLRGSPRAVLDRLARDFEAWAPDSVASLRALFESLGHHGVDPESIVLDLGIGRGIGFYSQMIFDLTVSTPDGTVELGGGGRYDGLARVFGSDRDDRGVGFAFGLERIDQVLRARADRDPTPTPPAATLVIPAATGSISMAVRLAAQIRARGGRAILESGWDAAEMANRARLLAARWSVVVPDPGDPAARVTLHDHRRGTQTQESMPEVVRLTTASVRESQS